MIWIWYENDDNKFCTFLEKPNEAVNMELKN